MSTYVSFTHQLLNQNATFRQLKPEINSRRLDVFKLFHKLGAPLWMLDCRNLINQVDLLPLKPIFLRSCNNTSYLCHNMSL